MLMLHKPDFKIIKDDNYCEKRREYVATRQRTYGEDGLPIKEDRHVYTLYASNLWAFEELEKFLTLELVDQKWKKEPKEIPANVDIVMSNHYTWALYQELGKHFLCDSS